VSTIRPNLPPLAGQPQPQRPIDPARLAAQKAFFAAALGQAQGAAPAPAPVQPTEVRTAAPARAAEAPQPAARALEPPQRILRPGSILDIRV
jgi:hypothetical protein